MYDPPSQPPYKTIWKPKKNLKIFVLGHEKLPKISKKFDTYSYTHPVSGHTPFLFKNVDFHLVQQILLANEMVSTSEMTKCFFSVNHSPIKTSLSVAEYASLYFIKITQNRIYHLNPVLSAAVRILEAWI